MKKSAKYLIYMITFAILVAFVLFFFLQNTAEDVTTTKFYEQMGVVTIDKDAQFETVSGDKYLITGENSKSKVLYQGDTFVIIENSACKIKKVVINSYNLIGYNESNIAIFKTSYGRDEIDANKLDAFASISGNVVDYSDPNAGALWSSLIVPLITILIGIAILFIFMRQAQGGGKNAMDFGKTKAKVNQNIKVRFSDVAGAEEEKKELQ